MRATPGILFQAFSETLRVAGVGLGVGDGEGFAAGFAAGVVAGVTAGVAAGAASGVAAGVGNVNGVGKSGTGFERTLASNVSRPVVDLFRSV